MKSSHMNLVRIALFLPLAACATFATAQWPTKPIRMVVTYAPGGGADLMARLIAPKMQESLGQPIVVENRGGAGEPSARTWSRSRPPTATR